MSRTRTASSAEDLKYVGFVRRSIAFIFDAAILLVLIAVAIQALDHVYSTNTVGIVKAILFGGSIDGVSSPYALLLTTSASQWAIILLCAHAVPLVYYTLFEFVLRATPGKLLTGLEVVNAKGKRLGIGAVIWRHISRYLSALLIFVGYFMAAWTTQRQTLHDMMSKSLVLYRRRNEVPLRYSPANGTAMMLCGVLALGAMAATVVPAAAVVKGYSVNKYKTQLVMHQIKDVVKEVEAYARETNVWPNHLGKLGLLVDDYIGGNVSQLEVVNDGVVVVTLQGADSLNGKKLVLSPSADGSGQVQWSCEGTAVSAGLASPGCVRG